MKRVAVILPARYRGGTLRAARDVASMLKLGHGEPLDVVFAIVGKPLPVPERRAFEARGVSVRTFEWAPVSRPDARRIASLTRPALTLPEPADHYVVPRDGAADLSDCDFWLFLSDRVPYPVLPLRPYGTVVFDALQRYVPSTMTDAAWDGQRRGLIPFIRSAEVVLVTTPATAADLHTFIGLPRERIRLAPLTFTTPPPVSAPPTRSAPYLVWATNRSSHKNHESVLDGLERYYEEHEGTLEAVMIGVETDYLRRGRKHPAEVAEAYLAPLRRRLSGTRTLQKHVKIAGEVSDISYRTMIAGARVLLHSSLYDNGTFLAFDAAALGVPTLSARYPAMAYLDQAHRLGVCWYDPHDPDDLAAQISALEHRPHTAIPDPERFAALDWSRNADAFRDLLAPWLNRDR